MQNVEIKEYRTEDTEGADPSELHMAIGLYGLNEDGRRVKKQLAEFAGYGFPEEDFRAVKRLAEAMLATRTLTLLSTAFKIPDGLLDGACELIVAQAVALTGLNTKSLRFEALKTAAALLATAAQFDGEELAATAMVDEKGAPQ